MFARVGFMAYRRSHATGFARPDLVTASFCAARHQTTVGSGNRRVFCRIEAVQSASAAASHGPLTSRTDWLDFLYLGKTWG